MAIQQLNPANLEKNWWAVMTDQGGGSIVQDDVAPDIAKDLVFPASEDGVPEEIYKAGTFTVLPGPLTLISAIAALKEAISNTVITDPDLSSMSELPPQFQKSGEQVVNNLDVVETSSGGKVDFEKKNFWAIVCEDLGGSVIQNDERPPEDKDIEFPEGEVNGAKSAPLPYKAGKFKVIAGPLNFRDAFSVLKETLSYPQNMWDKAIEKYNASKVAEPQD